MRTNIFLRITGMRDRDKRLDQLLFLIGKNITVLQIRKQLQQRNCLRAIVNISGRQKKSHRPQVCSDDGMDFRVQTSACFADAA